MPDNPNLERLKAAYAAWHDSKGRSPEIWLTLFADEVCICSMDDTSRGLDFAGERFSKQDAVGYFTALLQNWTMVHWTPESFVCDGDTIAMFGRTAWTNKATGKLADVRVAHLWRFQDGRIVNLTEVFDSARAVLAAT